MKNLNLFQQFMLGYSLKNAKLTQRFVDVYSPEIDNLKASMLPVYMRVNFDGTLPERSHNDPTRMWEFWLTEFEFDNSDGDLEPPAVGRLHKASIRLCWNNIIDKPYQLRFGFIALVQCLHVMAQHVAQPIGVAQIDWHCHGSVILPDEAMQQLVRLFPKGLTTNCICQDCVEAFFARQRPISRQELIYAEDAHLLYKHSIGV